MGVVNAHITSHLCAQSKPLLPYPQKHTHKEADESVPRNSLRLIYFYIVSFIPIVVKCLIFPFYLPLVYVVNVINERNVNSRCLKFSKLYETLSSSPSSSSTSALYIPQPFQTPQSSSALSSSLLSQPLNKSLLRIYKTSLSIPSSISLNNKLTELLEITTTRFTPILKRLLHVLSSSNYHGGHLKNQKVKRHTMKILILISNLSSTSGNEKMFCDGDVVCVKDIRICVGCLFDDLLTLMHDSYSLLHIDFTTINTNKTTHAQKTTTVTNVINAIKESMIWLDGLFSIDDSSTKSGRSVWEFVSSMDCLSDVLRLHYNREDDNDGFIEDLGEMKRNFDNAWNFFIDQEASKLTSKCDDEVTSDSKYDDDEDGDANKTHISKSNDELCERSETVNSIAPTPTLPSTPKTYIYTGTGNKDKNKRNKPRKKASETMQSTSDYLNHQRGIMRELNVRLEGIRDGAMEEVVHVDVVNDDGDDDDDDDVVDVDKTSYDNDDNEDESSSFKLTSNMMSELMNIQGFGKKEGEVLE